MNGQGASLQWGAAKQQSQKKNTHSERPEIEQVRSITVHDVLRIRRILI